MQQIHQPESRAAQIVESLKQGYSNLKKRKTLSVLFFSLAFLVGAFVLITFFERTLFLTGSVKTILFGFVFAGTLFTGFLTYRRHGVPGFRSFFEQFFTANGLKNALSATDLYLDENLKRSKFYTAALRSNLDSVDTDILPDQISRFVKGSAISRWFNFSLASFSATVLALIVLMLTMPAELLRTAHFWHGYEEPNPFVYTIMPGDTVAEHGSFLPVSIQFEGGNLPNQVTLQFKTDIEETYRERMMTFAGSDEFSSAEIDLTNSITYRIDMDGFLSEEYHINVQLQPRFNELIAAVQPPSYTGLSRREIEYPFSQISAYPGSEITFSGVANKTLTSILIESGELRLEMNSIGDGNLSFEKTYQPVQTDTLFFSMEDKDGLKNRNPYRTVINLRADQHPTVVIQEPTGTVMKSDPANIDIFYLATDDFGLTRAELRWSHQRAFVEEAASGNIPLQRPRNGRTEQINWDLSEFELRPRDEIRFRIRVWDNDEISGFKWSESQDVVIQIPSLTEYFEDLDSRERDTQTGLDEISEQFQTMDQQYQEFLERLRQNPDGGFEEEQMLEELRERQRNMDDAVRELQEQFLEMQREVEQSKNLSDETRRAYRELQQLMQELDDPDLREALEELQRALEGLSQQELERAMENVSFNENLYRERLERTVELFKRLKMNSDLDKLARQYEEMAERLMQQNEESTMEQLSRELENIRQDLDSVSDQLDQLDSNPPRRSEEMLRELKESAQQELQNISEQLDQLMQDTQNGGENGESGDSPSEQMQNQQQQLSQQMQQESERFRNSIQEMAGQQLNVNILALRQALYTLLEVSNMQEYLTQTASETRNRNQGFVELARSQNNVRNQFSIVADTLFQVSSELPGVPNQINRKKAEVERTISSAIDEMVERNQRGSTISTRESLGGINDLTSMIASLIDQLMDQQNGGGGGGSMSMQQMIEQLQNMSGDQQQLNQQLQDLINDAQGDRLSQDQQERLDQLARQQNEMRRQLQELQRSGALNQGDRLLSEMQRMIEDMEDSINEMRGGITDPLMVQRQQNILSRMLSAEQSLQQRGEDEEREGTDPTQYERVLPPDMTLEELQQEIRARMQDPNYTPFSERYQRIIEMYFERLRLLEEIQ
ncbi:MAG: hypothetical protein EA391_13970 [Balneolaceae bacterium]|nr:MAG: hypothetical protein EA391_13970 [Balneolaceae bacterium]